MTTLCEPMLLKAAGKHSLWGGDKLIKEYGKDYLESPLAETWECSTHENGLSYVDSGIWKGRTLKSVLKEHPEFLGSKYSNLGELPIIVKFIDANKDLSVQVHPNDEYAARYENGSRGKTEIWYVVEAEEQSQLIYGFYDNVSESIVREKLSDGNILDLLQKVPVKKGDVFYIAPGTVHALCGGVLVVEVQESSDLTYRLYDYDRLDKNGKKRLLQIDKACRICNYKKSNNRFKRTKKYCYYKCGMISTICQCVYFKIVRLVCRNTDGDLLRIPPAIDSFLVLICLTGEGIIRTDTNDLMFKKGDTIFIPYGIKNASVLGKCDLISVSC